MSDPNDGARALKLIQNQGAGTRCRIELRCQDELDDQGFNAEYAWDCIATAAPKHIKKFEPDRDRPNRHVVVLSLPIEGKPFYVKVSVNINIDHDPILYSFRPE